MNEYLLSFYIFIILFIIVYLVDYFLINKRKLNLIKNKGITKKGKKKKIKNISEVDYLKVKFKLKDTSYYSIVYQIWVKDFGWQKVTSDGEEAVYAHDKPIGGYRMALIPKTEKQYIVDYWNQDIGTNNIK